MSELGVMIRQVLAADDGYIHDPMAEVFAKALGAVMDECDRIEAHGDGRARAIVRNMRRAIADELDARNEANWYPIHEHNEVRHSHHRDNGGHGSHEGVPLMPRAEATRAWNQQRGGEESDKSRFCPVSTLTGQPCAHPADHRCIECATDDELAASVPNAHKGSTSMSGSGQAWASGGAIE
jgi:hypothetical protein